MLIPAAERRIWLCVTPTDMRRSFERTTADVSLVAGMLVDKFRHHLPLHRICCAPDYVAEVPIVRDARAFSGNLRNIIFRGQMEFRNAITPLSSFHGRPGPASAASHNAIALAFISRSISA